MDEVAETSKKPLVRRPRANTLFPGINKSKNSNMEHFGLSGAHRVGKRKPPSETEFRASRERGACPRCWPGSNNAWKSRASVEISWPWRIQSYLDADTKSELEVALFLKRSESGFHRGVGVVLFHFRRTKQELLACVLIEQKIGHNERKMVNRCCFSYYIRATLRLSRTSYNVPLHKCQQVLCITMCARRTWFLREHFVSSGDSRSTKLLDRTAALYSKMMRQSSSVLFIRENG